MTSVFPIIHLVKVCYPTPTIVFNTEDEHMHNQFEEKKKTNKLKIAGDVWRKTKMFQWRIDF